MPQISVIVPVYKVEPYLNRCVDSILGQSFRDFELILVDDGSPDNCGAICDEYARTDGRIRVIHQENGGLSAARNAGIDWAFANSDSQWLTFIDSDDWVHKDYLKILFTAVQQNETSIALCKYVCVNSTVVDAEIAENRVEWMDSEQAYVNHYESCISACYKVYQKELFLNLRFPVGKLYEDAFISHMLIFGAKKVAICDASLYYYFLNQDSITHTKWTERRLDRIEAHERRLAFCKKNGYEEAYKREINVYVEVLFEQVEEIIQLCKQDRGYDRYLQQIKPSALAALQLGRSYNVISLNWSSRNVFFCAILLKCVFIEPIWSVYLFLVKMKRKLLKPK